MATRLPSKLPGGRRRQFHVRTQTKTTGETTPFQKSSLLNNPAARASFANPTPTENPTEQSNAADATPFDDSVQDSIQPDFLIPEENQDSQAAQDPAQEDETTPEEQEAKADPADGQDSATNSDEASIANDSADDQDNLYEPGGEKRGIKSLLELRKTKTRIALATTLISIISAVFIAGPAALVTTISDMLTNVGDVQMNHQMKYRRKHISKVKDLFSKDGLRGGRLIAQMENKGYQFKFDPTDNNRIVGVKKPGQPNWAIGEGITNEFEGYMDSRIVFRKARWKTKNMNALYNRYGVKRKALLTLAPDPKKTAEQQINQDMADTTKATQKELDASKLPDDENATDEANDAAQENADEIVENQGTYKEVRDWIDAGNNVDEFPGDPELLASFKEGGNLGPGTINLAGNIDDAASTLSKSMGAIKSIGLSTDILDKLCTVNRALKGALLLARTTRSYALMNAALRLGLSSGDSVRMNKARSNLLREVGKRFAKPDFGGKYMGSSSGFQSLLKGKFSKSKNAQTRTAVAVDGQLEGWQNTLVEVTNKADVGGGCKVWTNGWAQGAIGLGETALTIATLGGAKAALTGSVGTLKLTVQAGFKSAVKKALASKFARGIVAGIALDIGFDQALAMVSLQTQKAMAGEFTGQESGELLGDMMVGGMGTANKQQSSQDGLVPTTSEGYRVALNTYYAEKRENLKTQSVFARYFDLNNTDSLAFKTSAELAFATIDFKGTFIDATQNTLSAPANLASTLLGFSLTGKASAQDSDEVEYLDYGVEGDGAYAGTNLATDFAGNLLLTMPEDVLNIDPLENLAYLSSTTEYGGPHITTTDDREPISNTLKKHLENCVYGLDTISVIEGGDPTKPEEDCMASLGITKRFKAYLAWVGMNDKVSAHTNPEEIDDTEQDGGGLTAQPTNGGGSTGANIANLTGPIIPCEGQPRTIVRAGDHASWVGITPTGVIGTNSAGQPINVYVRDACSGQSAVRTVVIGASIHGSENAGQVVAQDLLFNQDLPDDVRIIAIPEINGSGVPVSRRLNANGINLNRNFDYNWGASSCTGIDAPAKIGRSCKGPVAASEPETKAVQSFLESVGKSSLVISYHDNLNWVAPSGPNSASTRPLALKYASYAGMSCNSSCNNQGAGFFEAWYAAKTGTPALLVEMSADSSNSYINKHTQAIMRLLNERAIQ